VDSAGVCVASPRVLTPSDKLGWLGGRLRLEVDSVLVGQWAVNSGQCVFLFKTAS
jgi:hypothetical protein